MTGARGKLTFRCLGDPNILLCLCLSAGLARGTADGWILGDVCMCARPGNACSTGSVCIWPQAHAFCVVATSGKTRTCLA
eukprot:scaffold142553_cov22-Tisochrysis_lutea.AAC.1